MQLYQTNLFQSIFNLSGKFKLLLEEIPRNIKINTILTKLKANY